MEPLSGRTLQQALKSAGPLPVRQVTRVGLRLVDVLQATHRAGIVHRDVTPGNVHLCGGGRVVLTDFGIACTTDDASPAVGPFTGTPAYVSPERLDGSDSGPACDLFSLGATLFTAVEGRPPFDRGSLLATLTAVLVDGPAPFRRAGPLRPVIEGLLAKDPGRRLSAGQARAALRAIRREHDTARVGRSPGRRAPSRCEIVSGGKRSVSLRGDIEANLISQFTVPRPAFTAEGVTHVHRRGHRWYVHRLRSGGSARKPPEREGLVRQGRSGGRGARRAEAAGGNRRRRPARDAPADRAFRPRNHHRYERDPGTPGCAGRAGRHRRAR